MGSQNQKEPIPARANFVPEDAVLDGGSSRPAKVPERANFWKVEEPDSDLVGDMKSPRKRKE